MISRSHLFRATHAFFCLALLGMGEAGAVRTANPAASEDAKKILNYIAGLNGKADAKVLSGQFAGWGNALTGTYQSDVAQLNSSTGKWVALIGTDWHDFNSGSAFQPSILVNWWKAGGLVTVDYHFDNPMQNGTAWTTGGNIADLLNTSSGAYQKWKATLDYTAANLKTLQDAGVVVLWRPFHEQNGGWFWWGNKGQADFTALWKQMFTYFTVTKGLNNLLWVFAPNYGSNVAKYYPGDAYVDIVGLDAYFDRPKSIDLAGYDEMVALNKPFGLTEFGGVPAAGGSNNVFDNTVMIKEIKAKYPKLSFFMMWHCPWSIQCQQNASALLNDPWVVTRDELDWKNAPAVPIHAPIPAAARVGTGFSGEAGNYSVRGRFIRPDRKAGGGRVFAYPK